MVLVRCHGIPLRTAEAFRLSAIGFLLSFVSVGSVGGDLFKAVFLARRSPGKRVEAIASVLVDRGLGLYALLLIVVTVLVIAPPAKATEEVNQLARGAAGLAIAGTIALFALVTGGRWIDRMLGRFDQQRGIGSVVHRVADPLRVFHTHRLVFFGALLMSLVVQTLLAVSIFLIARGLYSAPPGLVDHLIIVPVGMVASALPLTPAGIGVLEAALEWLYKVIPATPTMASGTLVALTYEIVKIVLAALGMAFYWTSNREVQRSLETEPQSAIATPLPPHHG